MFLYINGKLLIFILFFKDHIKSFKPYKDLLHRVMIHLLYSLRNKEVTLNYLSLKCYIVD